MADILKHFDPSEFCCKCRHCTLGFDDMQPQFLKKLALARNYSNVPYRLNRAISCAAHNEKVGGLPTSSHLTGWAVDIEARTSARRSRIVSGLIKAGFHRIGIYSTFIHVDDDPDKPPFVMWLERGSNKV